MYIVKKKKEGRKQEREEKGRSTDDKIGTKKVRICAILNKETKQKRGTKHKQNQKKKDIAAV